MIRIREISKSFGRKLAVLRDLSFDCPQGEITSLVGPSGGGKTTLLNLIAKLDEQDSGDITIRGGTVPLVGYMLQEPLLLPWRTLFENSALGAEVMGILRPKMTESAEHYFDAFDLSGDQQTYPEFSSAGMKQRVALIRTLLPLPSVLLLDEPFSNLDFDIKLKVQRHLIDYHSHNLATTLLVTHDIEDAIALSDKVVVLSDKPAKVKAEVAIHLDTDCRDPVEARKSPKFREYFIQIWDELKYLDNND